jgi:hypothetical protein
LNSESHYVKEALIVLNKRIYIFRESLNMKKTSYIFLVVAVILPILIYFTTNAVADDFSGSASCGGIAGYVLTPETTDGLNDKTKTKLDPPFLSSSKTSQIASTDLIGEYELYSFEVSYDTGVTNTSASASSFYGTMTITHDRMTQNITVNGVPVIASGTWELGGNTLVMHNDFEPYYSVLTVSWDGTYLTTVGYFDHSWPYFIETDVWKKISTLTGPARIVSVTSDPLSTPTTGIPFRFTVNATGPEGVTFLYRFYVRGGYGLPDWGGNKWQVLREFSPTNSVNYTFPAPGNYYLVGHVVPAGESWEFGDLQGGFNVVVE